MVWGGGGGRGVQLPTFDAESKFTKITNSLYGKGGGELPTFDAESKSAIIPHSLYSKRGNFQLLMLSPNLLKSQNSVYGKGEG